jgi:hypothetical protein
MISDRILGLHKWYKISLLNEKKLMIKNKISKNNLCSFVNWFLKSKSFLTFSASPLLLLDESLV